MAAHLKGTGVALPRKGLSEEQGAEVIRLYGEGWSLPRLVERYGCAAETVPTYLKRSGVRRRAAGQALTRGCAPLVPDVGRPARLGGVLVGLLIGVVSVTSTSGPLHIVPGR